MIEQYAAAFGLDPDMVWQKETDDVVWFIKMWKERDEYNRRFRSIERSFADVTQQRND